MTDIGVIEAYSRLKALREHMPSGPIHQKYVAEFHDVLDLLERCSEADLSRFRIPEAEVRARSGGLLSRAMAPELYDGPSCDRSFFQIKVDGVLRMFEILMSGSGGGSKTAIGFKPETP